MPSPDTKKQKLDADANAEKVTATAITSINAIRMFSADMVQSANSGHPGAPMGLAPLAHVLFSKSMSYSPSTPAWLNRDRFVLSNGHGCALQYTMLHLAGYEVSLSECKKFRQLDSLTPGHPENFVTPGVEVCTGPLGQGLSNAVGMAIAEKHLAATFNQEGFNVVDNVTWCICGDGCLQEGVTSEACSLAGHLGLGKLMLFWDDNGITIDGSTELSFTEDVRKRFDAYGWQVLDVADVNDLSAVESAISKGKANTSQPTIVCVKTVIGAGCKKQGTHGCHGAPLGAEDLGNTKSFYNLNPDEHFSIPAETKALYSASTANNEAVKSTWDKLFSEYGKAHPKLHSELLRRFSSTRELPQNFEAALPTFTAGVSKDVASRAASKSVLDEICQVCPELMGGSADLTPSNLTNFTGSSDFQKNTPAGRYIRFGVREHAMAAICNGMFAFGGVRPFCASFLNFAGYALGAIRVSALSRFGVLFIMTHDSIGLGEDGPTHQPIEMLESLRSMPNVNLIRPADSIETTAAYKLGMETSSTPSVICLSRQTLPNIAGSDVEKCMKGGYVIFGGEIDEPQLVLVGSGSETGLCVNAAKILAEKGVKTRVVSMFCMDVFDAQSLEYKKGVILPGVPCVSVEASSPHGWHKYSHVQVAMERFGASAPAKDLFKKFGFVVDNVVEKGEATVAFYGGKGAPDVWNVPQFEKMGVGGGH